MQSKKLQGNKPYISTRKYLDIAEIRDDIVILRDGTLRVVVLVSSLNFSLKSEEEQDAIIAAYVNFLNSFDFAIQIVVQSRKLNVDNYLERLQTAEKEQENELLRVQISEYRDYIAELVKIGEIMTKKFYVVISYDPSTDKQKTFGSRLLSTFKPATVVRLQEKVFQRRKRELLMRVDHIMNGLFSVGVSAVHLDTQALIELYYNTYNPDVSTSQPMQPIENTRVIT